MLKSNAIKDYDIWGNPTLTVETKENAIRYAGEFYDSETGLYYLRARYYDPYIGRFTTEDSYWGEDKSPLSLNLYTYCENDPIQYTDPTGHMAYNEIEFYCGKEAAQKYRHEAEPSPSKSSSSNSSGKSSGGGSSSSSSSSSSSGSSSGMSANELEFYCGKGASLVYGADGNYRTGTVPMFKDGKITDVDCSKAIDLRNQNGYIIMTSDTKVSGNIQNYSNLDTLNIADNSYATITNYKDGYIKTINAGANSSTKVNNYGVMDTIKSEKNSSLFLDNYGKINNGVDIDENGTAVIVNYTGAYINDIKGGDTTETERKGMSIFNYGNIISATTGQNSENYIYIDYDSGSIINLTTGKKNTTYLNSDKNVKNKFYGDGSHLIIAMATERADGRDGYSNGMWNGGTLTGNKIGMSSIDFEKMPQSYKDSFNQLIDSIMNAKDDTELSIYTQMLNTWISNMSSPQGQWISKSVYYTSGVGGGTLQLISGATQVGTGWAVATGGSVITAGLASEIAIPFGGYLMADGVGNMAEGVQKAVDTIRVNQSKSEDTWNLVKKGFIKLSPENGEKIYNATQIGIGMFNVSEGIASLPDNAGKTYTWSKNIRNAETWGSKTETTVVSVGKTLILETKTESGMILQQTVLDGRSLVKEGFFITLDGYGVSDNTSSLIK